MSFAPYESVASANVFPFDRGDAPLPGLHEQRTDRRSEAVFRPINALALEESSASKSAGQTQISRFKFASEFYQFGGRNRGMPGPIYGEIPGRSRSLFQAE